MAIDIQKVHPGDLITAAYFDSIVDALNSLQAQIDGLGGSASPGPQPVITSTEPSPDVPVGSTLTIHGHNFAVPAVLNTVLLDGVSLGDFGLGSTDQLLRVQVPGNFPGVPKTAQLVVSTTAGAGQASVHLVPGTVSLEGAISVLNTTGTLPAGNPGDTLHLRFTLDANAVNIEEQYHVFAEFSNATGVLAGAWHGRLETPQDAPDLVIEDHDIIRVDPANPVDVGIAVQIPDGAEMVDMDLKARSVHNDPASSGVSSSIPITVGQDGPPADPSIHITLGQNMHAVIHPQDFTGAVSGSGLAIAYSKNPVVEMSVGVDHAGSYHIDGQVEDGADIWALTGLPQDMDYTDGQVQLVHFNLQLIPAGPSPGVDVTRYLTLTVTNSDDHAVSNFFRFPVGAIAT